MIKNNFKKLIAVENIFVLFLFSGFIKASMLVYGIKYIDLTLILSVVIMLYIVKNLMGNTIIFRKKLLGFFVVYIFFNFVCLYSLFYTRSQDYAYDKIIFFQTTLFSLFVPFFFKKFDYNYFFKVFTYASIFSGAFYSYQINYLYSNYTSESSIYGFRGAYLFVGTALGVSALHAFFGNRRNSIFRFLIFLILLILLIFSAAKGPILFFFLIFFFIVISKSLASKRHLKALNFSLFIIGLLVIINSFVVLEDFTLVQRTVGRFGSFFSGEEGYDGGRIDFYYQAIGYIKKNIIFGYGFGSYNMVTTGVDGRGYPHNIILEVFFELGFIGLIVMLYLIYKYAKILFSNCFLLGLSFFIFLNIMKAFSLTDMRMPFAIFAVILLISYKEKTKRGVYK